MMPAGNSVRVVEWNYYEWMYRRKELDKKAAALELGISLRSFYDFLNHREEVLAQGKLGLWLDRPPFSTIQRRPPGPWSSPAAGDQASVAEHQSREMAPRAQERLAVGVRRGPLDAFGRCGSTR